MKILKRIFIIILITFLIFSCLSFLLSANAMNVNDLPGTQTNKLDNAGNGILQVLAIIGSGLSIVFMICLGIKYMLGSVEERAEYKKSLLPYFIGAIFVFGASAIAGLIYAMFN